MSGAQLWKLEASASVETEEAVAELLTQKFSQPCSSYLDLKTGKTTVTLYFPGKPAWSKTIQSELSKALKKVLGHERLQLRLSKLRAEDWAESWKRHFHPLEIGARLLIKPSWSKRRSRPGQVTVNLDPGMSFGTGQHPTTGFCLRELARAHGANQKRSLLDLGTGSGILAICAAKLGYDPVEALELDPKALAIARVNARLNGVSQRVRFKSQDVSTLSKTPPRRYSMVCANLISNLLLAERERVVAAVELGGALVLAGILQVEFAEVKAAYEAAGVRLVRTRREGEWCSGSFFRTF